MLRMMNESIPPCQDVRQLACGAWLHSNPLPPSPRQRVRELIGTLPHPTRVSSLPWKVKHFYDSCMALDNVETDKALPLRKIITQLGGWHVLREFTMLSWDFRRVLELLHKDYGVSPFFRISVTVDGRKPNRNIIQISPSGLGLPDRSYYYRHPDSPVVSAYKRFLKDMVQLLGATSTDASGFSEEMFHFEKRIAEITPTTEELRDPALTNNLMTLEEIRNLAQSIPLQEILRAMFPMATIDDKTELLVVSKQYLNKVSMIISTTDRSALNNYVMWTFASAYLQYLSQEYADIVNAYRREMTGAKNAIPRWEMCVSTLQRFMGLAVTALYEKSILHRDADSKVVKDMFEELMKTMADEFMLEDSYLESYYEKFFVQKNDFFQNIRYGVSFAIESALRRYLHPTEEDRWSNSLMGYTARYEPTANRVVVPLSVLQPPFFQRDYPRAILYGSIGVRLSLAIVESAGPWGVLWDSEGKLILPDMDNDEGMENNVHKQASSIARQSQQCLYQTVVRSDSRDAADAANRTSYNILAAANAASLSYKMHCSSQTPQQQDLDENVRFHVGDTMLLRLTMRQLESFSSAFQCRHDSVLFSRRSCVQY
ncbi:hypothetical protein B566_EDAN008909 [Ephemera danica]|nr:hypothetical protein B566_EDAN008909 [Ephemera danica]